MEEEKKTEEIRKERKETIKSEWITSNITGPYKITHARVKSTFTIKRNNHGGGNDEKIGFCKNENCLKQCKIILYGKSEQHTELFYNQYSHLENCNLQEDIFKDTVFIDLCELNLKPTEIIKRFNEKNKDTDKQIIDTEENRKKISKIKYQIKPKDEMRVIYNMKQLEDWLETRLVVNLTTEELGSFSWDHPIVANYVIEGNKFAAYITTKNLQLNKVKQLTVENTCKAADGTYKLNTCGHPTIVVGVYDIHRKFHLSIILFFII